MSPTTGPEQQKTKKEIQPQYSSDGMNLDRVSPDVVVPDYGQELTASDQATISPTIEQQNSIIFDQNARRTLFGTVGSDEPGALIRMFVQKQMEWENESRGAKKIPMDEANQRWPGMNFSSPVFADVAQMLSDSNEERKVEERYNSRGVEVGTIRNLVQSLKSGAMDPVNLTLGRYGSKLYSAVGLKSASFMGNVGLGVATNTAENLALNLAIMPQLRAEGEQYGLREAATEAFVSALVASPIHMLSLKLEEKLNKADASIGNTETKGKLLAHGEQQAAQDKPVRADTILENERKARYNSTKDQYDFTPMGDAPDRKFYHSVDTTTGKSVADADELGGKPFSDNGPAENTRGHTQEAEITGKVVDVDQSADSPAGKTVLGMISDPLEKIGKKIADLELGGKTIREVLRDVKDLQDDFNLGRKAAEVVDVMKDLKEKLKGAGYAAFKYVHKVDGKDVANKLSVFDESAVKNTGEFLQNEDGVKAMDDELAKEKPTARPVTDEKFQRANEEKIKKEKAPDPEEVVATDETALKRERESIAVMKEKAKKVSKQASQKVDELEKQVDKERAQYNNRKKAFKTLGKCFLGKMV